MVYDFIVIGASIAGCAFSLNIRSDQQVLMLDKRDIYSDDLKNYKVCGGLISPDAQKELFYQRIPIINEFLNNPQVITVKNYDFDNNEERYFSRYYYNIDRQKFDRYLLDLTLRRTNVSFRKERVKFYEKQDEYYVVTTTKGEYHAKKLIIAQGANNSLSPCYRKTNDRDKYIVIQQWFENNGSEIDSYSAIFDKELTDFYGWIIPKGDLFLFGIAMNQAEEKNYRALFNQSKDKLASKGIDFSKPVHNEGCFLIRPNRLSDIKMGTQDIIVIGEAAGLISPSSAEGYSYALRSGRMVAESINHGDLDLTNIERYFKINIIKKWLKIKLMYIPMIRKLIYKTGIYQLNRNRIGHEYSE